MCSTGEGIFSFNTPLADRIHAKVSTASNALVAAYSIHRNQVCLLSKPDLPPFITHYGSVLTLKCSYILYMPKFCPKHNEELWQVWRDHVTRKLLFSCCRTLKSCRCAAASPKVLSPRKQQYTHLYSNQKAFQHPTADVSVHTYALCSIYDMCDLLHLQ